MHIFSFTYYFGEWDTHSLSYVGAGWQADSESFVTVLNDGEVAVIVSLGYTADQNYTYFQGSFTENGTPVNGDVALDVGAQKKFLFELDSTRLPATDLDDQTIGSVVVTITKGE